MIHVEEVREDSAFYTPLVKGRSEKLNDCRITGLALQTK